MRYGDIKVLVLLLSKYTIVLPTRPLLMGWREMKRLAGCGFCFLTCYHLTSTTGSPQMSPAVLVTTWTESKHSDSGWGKPLSLKTPLSPLETDSDHPNTGNKQKQILTFIFYHNSWTNTTWSDHHEQDSIKLWPLCILLNTWSPRQSKAAQGSFSI